MCEFVCLYQHVFFFASVNVFLLSFCVEVILIFIYLFIILDACWYSNEGEKERA